MKVWGITVILVSAFNIGFLSYNWYHGIPADWTVWVPAILFFVGLIVDSLKDMVTNES